MADLYFFKNTDDVIGVKCDLDLTRYLKGCGEVSQSEIDKKMKNEDPVIQGIISGIKIMTYEPFSPLVFKVGFEPLKSEYKRLDKIMKKFKIDDDEMIDILMGESTQIDDFVFSYGKEKHFEELEELLNQ